MALRALRGRRRRAGADDPTIAGLRSLDAAKELLLRGLRAALDGGAAPVCDACAQPATLTHAHYHLYHSRRGCDLVLTTGADASAPRLSAWTAGAPPAPLDALDGDDEAGLRRDAILRGAGACRDHEEWQPVVDLFLEAVETIPGDVELMRFVPRLCALQVWPLAAAIAGERTRIAPAAADGWFWSAQLLIEQAAQGGNRTTLDGAQRLLLRALECQPDQPDAEIALANLARLRGADEEARRLLRALIARHPGIRTWYALGLLLLDDDPAGALEQFRAGERNAPRDADYARGQARALLRLGRAAEARDAALRARALAPDNARITESSCRGRRGDHP